MLEKASNATKILMLFVSENAKNYAGLFYGWLFAEVIVKLTAGAGFQLAAGVISLQVFGEDGHPRGCRALGCFRYAVLEHFSHFVSRYGSKAFRDWFHYTEQAHKQ